MRVRLPAGRPVLQKPLTYRHFQRFGHCRPGATQGTLLGLPDAAAHCAGANTFPHRITG